MKIAIPVNEDKKTVCMSFGRAPLFALIDTEDESISYLDNNAVAAQGGAGIKAAQALVDQKVNALITMRCGQNAADVLKAANIKIYKHISEGLEENISAFKQDQLNELSSIHPGFHHHGGH